LTSGGSTRANHCRSSPQRSCFLVSPSAIVSRITFGAVSIVHSIAVGFHPPNLLSCLRSYQPTAYPPAYNPGQTYPSVRLKNQAPVNILVSCSQIRESKTSLAPCRSVLGEETAHKSFRRKREHTRSPSARIKGRVAAWSFSQQQGLFSLKQKTKGVASPRAAFASAFRRSAQQKVLLRRTSRICRLVPAANTTKATSPLASSTTHTYFFKRPYLRTSTAAVHSAGAGLILGLHSCSPGHLDALSASASRGIWQTLRFKPPSLYNTSPAPSHATFLPPRTSVLAACWPLVLCLSLHPTSSIPLISDYNGFNKTQACKTPDAQDSNFPLRAVGAICENSSLWLSSLRLPPRLHQAGGHQDPNHSPHRLYRLFENNGQSCNSWR
jgi:hypothetical protein